MTHSKHSAFPLLALLLVVAPPPLAAQDTGDDTQQLEAIEVTGSRIRRADVEGQTPILTVDRDQLEASGISSIGDILQRLSASSSALNTKFNSAGNFGFPSDSGGVGSGSTTVSLRNLGAKRVLVLVDGIRWVNESSASGVNAAVDLNTIPFSVVERIEILTDGASALYGSDAIAGVVNIITRKKQEGGTLRAYAGNYDTGDGGTRSANVSLGGSASGYDFFMDLSHFDQNGISSNDWSQSRFPVPGTGLSLGSSATPTTRSVFFEPANSTQGGLCPLVDTDDPPDGVPDTAFCNITGNGTAAGPSFTPAFPTDFHGFVGANDRFNFAPFNLLLTPSQRSGLFTQVRRDVGDDMSAWFRGMFQSRESVNQAAPEPIFIGPGAGTGGLADTIGVHDQQVFNPFPDGAVNGANFNFAARRPVEGGPRVFTQNVETRYLSAGLQGSAQVMGRQYFWDLNLLSGRNRANQTVQGSYNIAHIARALGDPANCTDPCVPLNFFGGPGTITPDMLAYIGFTENDRSVQGIDGWSANLSGGVLQMPAGPLEVAAGVEHRRLSGKYSPDAIVTAGETNGVPSLPTSGAYSVDELYVETRVPLVADVPAAKALDLSAALRYSDYSTFGSTTNAKFGVRWQPADEVTARATYAEGFRAPSVGELYGSPARFDATIVDPCNRPVADPVVSANCTALGVPAVYTQANTQISVATGGNPDLQPETADSTTAGVLYSPAWADKQAWADHMDLELTYYQHEIDESIQPIDAQTQLTRCAATLDPEFCTGITRGVTGDINGFDNTLRNLGTVETAGYDIGVAWIGPPMDLGQFGADWQSTYVDTYKAVSKATGLREPNGVGVEVNDSSIPRFRSNLHLSWRTEAVQTGWTLRYVSSLTEQCGNGPKNFPVCSNPNAGPIDPEDGLPIGLNDLDAILYHDVRVTWHVPVGTNVRVSAGINNVFGTEPPVCLSCSLNGYDASLYDLPGQFGYVEASVGF
jgi:iron complex outermembrane receptor protein